MGETAKELDEERARHLADDPRVGEEVHGIFDFGLRIPDGGFSDGTGAGRVLDLVLQDNFLTVVRA